MHGARPLSVSLTDVDGDGRLDLVANLALIRKTNPTRNVVVGLAFWNGIFALNVRLRIVRSPQPKKRPTVTIGGISATVDYSGLAPGFVGLCQVNADVPQGVLPGSSVPVVICRITEIAPCSRQTK